MNRILLAGVLFLLPGCALWNRFFFTPPPPGVPAGAIELQTSYARAAGVALADFFTEEQKNVDRLLAEPRPDDPRWKSNLEFAECFTQPDAYDTYVGFDAEREVFIVMIRPVPEVCLGDQGYALVGGGGKYEIDPRSYLIVGRRLME